MDFWKYASSISKVPLNNSLDNALEMVQHEEQKTTDVDVDLREVYFLIMQFLSYGPCQKTFRQFWNELLEHELLARRHHAWFSRSGAHSGVENDDGVSLPLSYNNLVARYPHIEKDHLIKLLKQLLLHLATPVRGKVGGHTPNAADVPTLLGSGSFSLLDTERSSHERSKIIPLHLRWPHMQANQVHGLGLREIGGGFVKHHRAPSIRSACYTIAKPLTMVQKMQNIKKCRGHRDAVYCAIFDRSGRYVITGSDDRLVKIWAMETALCLASCRGHEGDITDLAVSSNNAIVASASNDFVIRVWRLPDGLPISVLRGHTGAVTAIAFSPRHNSVYQLLSSSDDGTCRIWDARYSHCSPRIYVPKPSNDFSGKDNVPSRTGPSSSNGLQSSQILCCAYNANGTVFVTGSSDTYARVWSASKSITDESDQSIHEIDVLSGHENDVNYVQFSGCAAASRSSFVDSLKEENFPKFKNTWFCHDNIVTCSRDGSAIIWAPRSRRSHGKSVRWTKLYHLKVPPPPLPPQPPRGGPRQRILPTPRGVNMIVWSLDNRFVLAAIMDCRICVWNAADSSLVHSLTGHTASSYVLDVHPFNPRIAMSAGYDGRTIVWDIWEGIPIRVYEIALGRFKLVDGKFSPDGTSIVLSDDVGQIYLINTGQGESQKDAKYDQFFLGDYRPLIRDAAGNVLDQESQLPPHRRNFQDPLCDSSLIPYPEPYQTVFQQRRHGALGSEWRPPSIKFATGLDFSIGLDYQMPPLEDLDRMIEPLPEFLDAIYLEPENEIISHDTDSEYNLTEDCTSEGERGNLRYISPSDSDCSMEESDSENGQKDGLRRSRRHHKNEVVSSRRHVKKRNLNEYDGLSSRINGAKKQKSGRRVSKGKSSKGKPSRPQRVAARNAKNMLSKITSSSTDGDESEEYTSSSGSGTEDSIIERNTADGYLQNMEDKYAEEDKHILNAEKFVKCSEPPESQPNLENRRKLVLKFSLRQSKKPESPDNIMNAQRQTDNVTSCNQSLQDIGITSSSKDPVSSSLDGLDMDLFQNRNKSNTIDTECPAKDENDTRRFFSENEGKIRWGEVKTRSSKHPRLEDATPGDSSVGFSANNAEESRSNIGEDKEQFEEDLAGRDKASIPLVVMQSSVTFSPSRSGDLKSKGGASSVINNRAPDGVGDFSGLDMCRNLDELGGFEYSGSNHCQGLKENPPPKLPRLKIKVGDLRTSSLLTCRGSEDALQENTVQSLHKNSPQEETNQRVETWDEGANRSTSLYDVLERENLQRSRAHLDELNYYVEENAADATRRTRSMKMKATSWEPNDVNYKKRVKLGREIVGTSNNDSIEHLSEERIPNSRITIRASTARNRRGDCDSSYLISRHPSQPPARKISWLILPKREYGGYRYIPQLGDEVVYLRQGHQEYIESRSDNLLYGPWTSIKGNISDVEICKVEKLDYAASTGSGDGCCKIVLRFVNPQSGVFGEVFNLTLPELIDFPDFIVEKTWYDAAISRNWSQRDKCLVWWKNANGDGGSWWEGRIVSSEAKSKEFPNSPWERYTIFYKSDQSEQHRHCPWELHDSDMPWEHPHIDFVIRDKLLNAFYKLEKSVSRNQDKYGIQKLDEVSDKMDFFNRFPVPLCRRIIVSRLENNYYRNLEAVEHDIGVMMENARSYFAKNAALSLKMERLDKWYTKKLSKVRKFYHK